MPIVMVQNIPGGTQEQYEKVAARLTGGRGLGSIENWPVEGILSHVAGPTADGWQVVDVWESEEAFGRFGSVIGPILQEVGMVGPGNAGVPEIYPAYNFVK